MTLPAGAFRMVRPLTVLGLSFGLLCSAGTAASAGTAGSAGLTGSAGRTVPAGPALSGVPASKGTGWLQLAHLSPNTPAVDVYLYSFGKAHAMIVLKHVSYGTVSPYEPVRSGEYTVAMRSAGASPRSKPVLSTSVVIAAGHAYTVAGMGPLSGLRLEVLRDRLTTPRGQALVRVIQASLQQHQVTVTAGKHVLAAKEAFAKVSSYQVVRPGTWMVRAAGAARMPRPGSGWLRAASIRSSSWTGRATCPLPAWKMPRAAGSSRSAEPRPGSAGPRRGPLPRRCHGS